MLCRCGIHYIVPAYYYTHCFEWLQISQFNSFHCAVASKCFALFLSNCWSHSLLFIRQKKPKKEEFLIFSQQEALPWFTMLSIYSEIHSVKCINHIKWCVGLLLAGWVKCIPCQTRQPAGPLRKILIDTAVAFNQLGKHESSLRCAQACLCQRKGKQSGGGGRDAEKRRGEDKF